jgi:methionyl-tRNA formyltransferase
MSSNLIFFGNERLSSGFVPQGAPVLEALIKAGYTVSAVVANQHQISSRKVRKLEIETVANTYNIPLLLPRKLSDIYDELKALQAPAAVLVAYGKIIPQIIIDLFPKGIINIHPSLLPQYRGSTPIEQVILDGASKTGVSLMRIVQKMDAGPIYAQETISLTGKETKQALTARLLTKGAELLTANLDAILHDKLFPSPQDESKASFTPQLTKDAGIVDWSLSAIQIERQIRAYAVWPKSRATIYNAPLIITKGCVVQDYEENKLIQRCGEGFLEIQELIAPSGKTMSGVAFIKGYKK